MPDTARAPRYLRAHHGCLLEHAKKFVAVCQSTAVAADVWCRHRVRSFRLQHVTVYQCRMEVEQQQQS
eukprot:5149491-Prymnesium_polylepis.1